MKGFSVETARKVLKAVQALKLGEAARDAARVAAKKTQQSIPGHLAALGASDRRIAKILKDKDVLVHGLQKRLKR